MRWTSINSQPLLYWINSFAYFNLSILFACVLLTTRPVKQAGLFKPCFWPILIWPWESWSYKQADKEYIIENQVGPFNVSNHIPLMGWLGLAKAMPIEMSGPPRQNCEYSGTKTKSSGSKTCFMNPFLFDLIWKLFYFQGCFMVGQILSKTLDSYNLFMAFESTKGKWMRKVNHCYKNSSISSHRQFHCKTVTEEKLFPLFISSSATYLINQQHLIPNKERLLSGFYMPSSCYINISLLILLLYSNII